MYMKIKMKKKMSTKVYVYEKKMATKRYVHENKNEK